MRNYITMEEEQRDFDRESDVEDEFENCSGQPVEITQEMRYNDWLRHTWNLYAIGTNMTKHDSLDKVRKKHPFDE